MFKVKHKKTEEIYEVYNITYSMNARNIPVPFFLVYISGKFKAEFASEFKPYIEEPKQVVKKVLNEEVGM